MDTDKLMKALGDAAAAARPSQEYCLFWYDSWATCMTKAEWSGWMQAIGALVALLVAIGIPLLQKMHADAAQFEQARQCLLIQCALIDAIRTNVRQDVRGARSAVVAAQENCANLLARYREVRTPPLGLEQMAAWVGAQATAARLNEFVAEAFAGRVPRDNIAPALDLLMESSVESLVGFDAGPVPFFAKRKLDRK